MTPVIESSLIMENTDIPFELASLARAQNYQAWVARVIQPYIGARTLEVGAGIGNMSRWLPLRGRLILTESEPALMRVLQESINPALRDDPRVSVRELNVLEDDLEFLSAENLDTIVSFNVLEHIEDDERVLTRLCAPLRDSKAKGPRRLVTFVPAHQWAYGSMDKGFGHHRRYSRARLAALCQRVAPEARLTMRHFNAFGLAGWILNGRILKRPSIGVGSITAFERLCPWLAPVDDFLHEKLGLRLGQSLLAVLEF
jgi:hypothetical protein